MGLETGQASGTDWRLERACSPERQVFTEILEIQCAGRSRGLLGGERVVAVGGTGADGRGWKLTLEEAIAAIESGRASFWIGGEACSSWLMVARDAAGRKYLEVRSASERPLRLQSLPECLGRGASGPG